LSYHLAITALAFGVPVFTPADRSEGKYSALKSFDTIYDLPDATVEGRDLFLARLGITSPSPKVKIVVDSLARHWDHIAFVLRDGKNGSKSSLDRFWQGLPALMEESYGHSCLLEGDCLERNRVEELQKTVAQSKAEIMALHESPSMRATAPFRYMGRTLKRLLKYDRNARPDSNN